MAKIFENKRVNRDKCSFATKQRMLRVSAIDDMKPLRCFAKFMPP